MVIKDGKMCEMLEKEVTNTTSSLNITGDVYGPAIGQNITNINVLFHKESSDPIPNLVDKTSNPMHFNLMSSEKKLSDVFIDGCYQICENGDFDEKVYNSSPKIKDCIEILNNQKVLLIEGEYGTGKTVLTKMIQQKLILSGKTTLYLEPSIFSNKKSFSIIQDAISSTQEDLFVFIDSVDDLNCAVIENDNAVVYLIKEILKLAFSYKNAFFVINSRPNLKINTKNELITQEFVYECSQYKNSLMYVRIRGFENEDANDFFDRLNNSDKPSLDTTQLKRLHRKAHSSYKNPLFDYVVGSFYYDNNNTLSSDFLSIYSHFVTKTINGKFQGENPHGSVFVEKTQENYRKLLQRIAKEMIANRSESIDYKFDDENSFFFQKSKEPFYIELDCLKNNTIELYNKFCEENGALDKGVYDASFLNCYFFKVISIRQDKTLVSFSDENIMCYLAAESAYKKFCDLVDEYPNKNEADKALLCELSDFELHPLSMDFLVFLLRQLMRDEIETIVFRLRQMINEFNSCKSVSNKEVKAQLIIQIIFIKFYDKSYKAINSQHFFKSFDKLCKTAKAFEINGRHKDGEHRFLAERYFSCCSFVDCCFRRLNLKHYNYKNSKIRQTTFEQCKLEDNIFEGSLFDNSRFSLCILKDIIFNFKIAQEYLADNCKIINCKLENITLAKSGEVVNICFKECSIEKLGVIELKSGRITISFERCFIKEIYFNDCTRNNCISIENCVVENPIRINNSKLRIKDQNNLIPSSQLLIADNRSEISL